jgi:hypothetical protein
MKIPSTIASFDMRQITAGARQRGSNETLSLHFETRFRVSPAIESPSRTNTRSPRQTFSRIKLTEDAKREQAPALHRNVPPKFGVRRLAAAFAQCSQFYKLETNAKTAGNRGRLLAFLSSPGGRLCSKQRNVTCAAKGVGPCATASANPSTQLPRSEGTPLPKSILASTPASPELIQRISRRQPRAMAC